MEFFDDQGLAGRFPSAAFSREFSQGRQARKNQAASRSPVHAVNRSARRVLASAARAEKANSVIMRRLNRELGLDRDVDIWGRSFRIRVKAATARAVKTVALALKGRASGRSIMTYSKPIRDRRGRIAVFMRVRYKGFRSPGWRGGMTGEHIHYIFRADAIEPQFRDRPLVSNMGISVGEIAAGWGVLEEVEEAYRANAIVQHRIVLGMPYQLTPAGRRRVLERFCERAFGRLGLPYAASNHLPDTDGDERNYHAHVAFSTRPMSHIGEHQWEVVQEKVNGITDPDGLARMRALFAAIVNQECRRESLDLRLTHQRYDKRGIDARRQEHLGPQLTTLHRQGKTVDMAVRNERTIAENEARGEHREACSEVDEAAQQIAQLERDIHALAMLEISAKARDEERHRDLEAHPKVAKNGPRHQQIGPVAAVGPSDGQERSNQSDCAMAAPLANPALKDLRMDESKEKAVRELSSDEGAKLMIRLERERPTLHLKNDVIGPVDTRPFTEAELGWMRRDLLTMHRLLLEQHQEQEAAEAKKEQVRLAIEVRRLAALEHDGARPRLENDAVTSAATAVDRDPEPPLPTVTDAKPGLADVCLTKPTAPERVPPAAPNLPMDAASRQAAEAAWAAAQAARMR